MATDPTKRIRRRRVATPFTMGAEDFLDRLGHLAPSTEAPYLTVTVDWRPEGSSPGRAEPEEVRRSQRRAGVEEEGARWRPAIEILEDQVEDLIEAQGERGVTHDSLREDYKNIMGWLQNELDPAAHGACVVANSSMDVFEATGFLLPLPTEIHVGPTPAVYSLVQMVEDYPVYGVLNADQQEAVLSFIAFGGINRQVTLVGNDYPRHQQQGGWSQRRYQNRAGERIDAFARDVAEETRKQLDRLGVHDLIVGGNEVMTSALDDAFHESVKKRIVATIPMDMTASDSDTIEATMPIVTRVEREREEAAVRELTDMIGMDARGASGPADTLRALQNGQVDVLVMVDTFEGTGWADYEMHVFGIGDLPTSHPVGGDVSSLVTIDLREEMVRLALETGAEVDIIHSAVPFADDEEVRDVDDAMPMSPAAKTLQDMGGVGAILRYSLDETPPDEAV